MSKKTLFLSLLDIVAITSWGLLLFKYWFTGQLSLLIHPNYFILVIITSILLLMVSLLKIYKLVSKTNSIAIANNYDSNLHSNLLPQGWASTILILVAFLGLTTKPIVLASQVAMQRGVIDSLPPTTQQPQAFITNDIPEQRSLIEWVRTLNAYPEPDNYAGQKAEIKGFVMYLEQLPDNYLYLSRFILTCCAVDAYPVGIIVELPESRRNYLPDSWLKIQGVMTTQILPSPDDSITKDKRQLVLRAKTINSIPTPRNPYEY